MSSSTQVEQLRIIERALIVTGTVIKEIDTKAEGVERQLKETEQKCEEFIRQAQQLAKAVRSSSRTDTSDVLTEINAFITQAYEQAFGIASDYRIQLKDIQEAHADVVQRHREGERLFEAVKAKITSKTPQSEEIEDGCIEVLPP
ncbi:hypothetical protein BKA93DRAFT_827818 [Sparassis latifolia]|uniref:Uncharacterized protein n=1 Tax=Sparassis crispa TaxID=139825 RepID=A0A401GSI2_9APHY|nr:hypothetical protein SCP_0703740 [Sparassis crispa]GBE85188.1 hypothetical protein SCP_0703740 [Sparassis crispa]